MKRNGYYLTDEEADEQPMMSSRAAAASNAARAGGPSPEERQRRSEMKKRRREVARRFTNPNGEYRDGEELADMPPGEFIVEEGGSRYGPAGYVIGEGIIWRVKTLKCQDGSSILEGWSLPFTTAIAEQIREVL